MEEHSHNPEDIAKRLGQRPGHNYTQDWVYGGIDGAITTFAIVAGVMGAGLALKVIIILGIANVVADGFSMAASNYLSVKAEKDQYQYLESMEYHHIENFPEGEVEEVRQIYRQKGFAGELLEKIVTTITADKKQWVSTMMREEFGLPVEIRSPIRSAMSTFLAFLICGLVPLFPFVLKMPKAFEIASVSTMVVFFIIGSLKSRWSVQSWMRSGLITMLLGGAAAVIAFGLGRLIENLAFLV